MWSDLPFDLLAEIFYFLSPDTFVRAKSVCKNWAACAAASPPWSRRNNLPWFVAMPARAHRHFFFCAHNPTQKRGWHLLPSGLIPPPVRPVASVAGMVILRLGTATALQLAVCNPFTGQFRRLPAMNTARTNPAVGVVPVEEEEKSGYRIYVAGGMSEGGRGGASYVPTVETYDPDRDEWALTGSMPTKYAVRLTVWTPREGVYNDGVLYWISSARAYSVVGFEVRTNKWKQFKVPMGESLEFAALAVKRRKLLALGGGEGCDGGGGWVWELGAGGDDDAWRVVERVPFEMGRRLVWGEGSWGDVKGVGIDGVVCLYRDLGDGVVVWRECGENSRGEWSWIEGYGSLMGSQSYMHNSKGVLLHPKLDLPP